MQRASIELLSPENTQAEAQAIQTVFSKKRERLVSGLRDLGFVVDLPPEGTFYVWASAKHLPSALSTGADFFQAALKEKVIAVPGEFFGVDPGRRRGSRPSRFRHHLRFSFGPKMSVIDTALSRIKTLIENAK